jgi:hypothetical protein
MNELVWMQAQNVENKNKNLNRYIFSIIIGHCCGDIYQIKFFFGSVNTMRLESGVVGVQFIWYITFSVT